MAPLLTQLITVPIIAAYWMWAIWYVTWWMAGVWTSRAAARPRPSGKVLHRLFAMIGVFLLFWVPTVPTSGLLKLTNALGLDQAEVVRWIRPLWSTPPEAGWALLGAVALCFAFCWWARVHLGRLWSGSVTVKADHRIVDTGPYRIVRHPIYTGIIIAAFLTALIKASIPALLGFGFLWLGFFLTARIEEGFLRQELGEEAYDNYSLRTPMLIPFVG
jgi:protein-S-isoprenylcysteine O-methyltransferase Ste14